MDTLRRKGGLRETLAGARTLRDADQLLAVADALASRVEALRPPPVVALYLSIGTEPPTRPLLDALLTAGVRVLLPVVRPGGVLDWSDAEPATAVPTGRLGLLEPVGRLLGPEALNEAGLVLVPALAVDRTGARLGRGGGYYDRALAARPRTGRVVAVVFDEELLDEVPAEAHDQPVDGALMPSGLVMFRGRPAGAHQRA